MINPVDVRTDIVELGSYKRIVLTHKPTGLSVFGDGDSESMLKRMLIRMLENKVRRNSRPAWAGVYRRT